MDITPELPEGRKLIEGYGGGGFRISGERFEGSLLVFPTRVDPWPVAEFDDIIMASLGAVADEEPPVELLIVGCGPKLMPPPAALRDALRGAGIVADFMDTGAACRTYNVLLTEDRRVAAALIAVE